MAIANYAANHDDFYEVMLNAALDHLLDGVLTDDLFAPDKEFAPTKEEVDTMNRAKETAELVNGLFHGLAMNPVLMNRPITRSNWPITMKKPVSGNCSLHRTGRK